MILFHILPFDEAAARQFDNLRRQKLRIGSRDLKIAATVLVHHASLVRQPNRFQKSARLASRELAGLTERRGRNVCETESRPCFSPSVVRTLYADRFASQRGIYLP